MAFAVKEGVETRGQLQPNEMC